jgi:multidrug efflux system outer membrane protein
MCRILLIKKFILTSTLIAVALTACHLPRQLAQPAVIADLPATYLQANADSNSIGATPWKLFFTDPVLQQLIDTALTKNLELLHTDQQIKIAGTYLGMAKALTFPTLEAVINTQIDRYAFYTMNGIGNYDLNKSNNITSDMRIPNALPDLMIGFRSQWEIDVWGKLKNMKKSAMAKYLGTIQGKLFLQTNIVAEVAYRYYELLGLDFEIDIVRKNILLQQNALEIVKAQKLGGRATELAVLQFEALVYKTKAIEYGVRQQIAETENRLNLLLGRYPQAIRRGQGLMQLNLPVIINSGVPANLLLMRPDVSRAMYDLTAAYRDVAVARAMYYPAFNITPYIGFQGFRLPAFFNAQSIAAGIAGNIAAPIFNRKRVRGNYSISEAQANQTWIGYNRTMQNAVMEVQTSLQGIYNLSKQYELKQQEVRELASAISTANDLYANGYANYLEVITAQKSLVDAEIELTLMKKVQFQTMVALYRASGGGWK